MSLLKMLKKWPVVLDGAMGTNLAKGEFCSKLVCNEAYNLYAPELVEAVHRSFIDAGCDVIETNALNANRISLAEFDLNGRVREINLRAAEIAKGAAACASRKILVAGNIGPTPKLPSMGQISFDELHEAYVEQIGALIDGGVDLIIIETSQDILQVKTAVIAANDVFEDIDRRLPLITCVTIDQTGRMLLGTEPEAVIATLLPLGVDVIGLNCGVGPKGMEGAARFLANHSPLPVLLMPNAGLPEIVDGETRYNLGAEEFARSIEFFVRELGVEMVGGCCGTTPEHIGAVVKRLANVRPKKRKTGWQPKLSSLFSATSVRQTPPPLIIGERMNINGSKRFKEFILKDDFDGAASIAADQEAAGAHALDISVAYAGRDETRDMQEVAGRTVQRAQTPLCIDSTSPSTIESALKMIPGRAIINSINLEDGGGKAGKILELTKRFGCAVIALTIDEDGMARDADKKCKIAERIIKLCVDKGVEESSIFLDLLTFTLAEPKAATLGSGAETIKALKKIKKRHPGINTVLGVSNISYGFKRGARRVLNSLFLQEAVESGLDAAIVHAGQIIPVSSLDSKTIEIGLDLVRNRRKDALDRFLGHFETREVAAEEIREDLSPREGVRLSILRGDKMKVQGFLERLIVECKPKEILNDILLPAMGEVGRLFDKGGIPLPYVLQSAEAMKRATDCLAPYFDKDENVKRGKIVLATVRGDVHDIGKNLVDIIFSNNGFDVINLGVKQPIDTILKAASENGADVIGLSGLLVESALIMKDDLAELAHRGVEIPVICGGAALTEKFVEKDLASVYAGPVFYAGDAFEGLKIMEKVMGNINPLMDK